MDNDLSSVEEYSEEINSSTRREGLTLISLLADEFMLDWTTRIDERIETLDDVVVEIFGVPLSNFINVTKLRESGMTEEMRLKLPKDDYPLDIDSLDKFCIDPTIFIFQSPT